MKDRRALRVKGGTSPSKSYAIISRSSADADVLLTPRAGESTRAERERLLDMTERVADRLGLEWE